MREKERKIREVLGDNFPLLPEILNLLKSSIEVGKYYKYEDIFFKVVKIEGSAVWGYGLIEEGCYSENSHFADLDDYEDIEEITKEEFLGQIAKYAVDVLGFREGVEYTCTIGRPKVVIHKPKQFMGREALHCGYSQGFIFLNGKFAEIIHAVDVSGNDNHGTLYGDISVLCDSTETWQPTMELRWQWNTHFDVETVTKQIKDLQQKWVETNTGAEQWRKIETV